MVIYIVTLARLPFPSKEVALAVKICQLLSEDKCPIYVVCHRQGEITLKLILVYTFLMFETPSCLSWGKHNSKNNGILNILYVIDKNLKVH